MDTFLAQLQHMYRHFLFLGAWLYLSLVLAAPAPANHAEKFLTENALPYLSLNRESYQMEVRRVDGELTEKKNRLATLDLRRDGQQRRLPSLRTQYQRANATLKKSTRTAQRLRHNAEQSEMAMVRRREGAKRGIEQNKEAVTASRSFVQRLRRGLALLIISFAIGAAGWLLWKPGLRRPSRNRLFQASGLLGCACALFVLGKAVDEPKRYDPPSAREKARAALASPDPRAQAPPAVRRKRSASAQALQRYQRDRETATSLRRQLVRVTTIIKQIQEDRQPFLAPIEELESRRDALAEIRAQFDASP